MSGRLSSNDFAQLCEAFLAIGTSDHALLPILCAEAVVASREATDEAAAAIVVDDFKKLSADVRRATGHAQLTQLLTSPIGRRYGLDVAIERALKDGTLISRVDGYSAAYALGSKSVTERAVTEVGLAFASTLENDKSKAYNALSSVFTDIIPTVPRSAIDILTQENMRDAYEMLMDSDAANGNVNPQKFVAMAQTLIRKSKDLVRADVVNAVTSIRGRVSPPEGGFELEPSTSEFTLKSARVGLTMLDGLLTVAGLEDSEEARFARRAVSYAQGAIQVQQSVAAIVMMGTGWGAALSIAGMAAGIGGLTPFGMDEGAGSAQQEVLDAIQAMVTEMRQRFAATNRKLEKMTELLETLLREVRIIGATIDEIRAMVERTQRQLSTLLVEVTRSTFLITQRIDQENNLRCKTCMRDYKLLLTSEAMAHCRAFYSDLALRAAAEPLLSPALSEDAALTSLRSAFRGGGESAEMWRNVSTLANFLDTLGIPCPAPPVFEPALAMAMENYAKLQMISPQIYSQIRGGVTEVDDITKICERRDGFHRWLRNPAKDGVLSKLSLLKFERMKDFFRGLSNLAFKVKGDRIGGIEGGTSGYKTTQSLTLVNANAASGSFIWTLTPTFVGLEGVSKLLVTNVPEPGQDNSPLTAVLTSWNVVSRSRYGYFGQNNLDTSHFTVELRLYELRLTTIDLTFQLDFEGAAAAAYKETDGVKYLSMCTSTPQLLLRAIAESMVSDSVIAEARKIQAHRLTFTDRQEIMKVLLGPKVGWETTASVASDLENLWLLDRTALAIEVVCKVAYADAYDGFDGMQAMLEGGPDTSIFGLDSFQAWYLQGDDAEAIAFSRFAALATFREDWETRAGTPFKEGTALASMLESGQRRGTSFPFERVKALFLSAFPKPHVEASVLQ